LNRQAIKQIATCLLDTQWIDDNRPRIHWPKKKFNQTLEQYAKELGVEISDIPVLKVDKYIGMKNYKGYGWVKIKGKKK
jgi:hypothetical protein